MKFSALAVVLSALVANFGEVSDGEATFFQEDFAGDHNLSRAIWYAGIPVICRDIRDVSRLVINMGVFDYLTRLTAYGQAWSCLVCAPL